MVGTERPPRVDPRAESNHSHETLSHPRFTFSFALPLGLLTAAAACSDDESTTSGGTTTGTAPLECDAGPLAFPTGDPNGHPDPMGAKAAGQARAGRIQAASVPQPAHGKFRIEDGDFLLVNDQIAVTIEDMDVSDGYSRFGGEILAVDRVDADGVPLGRSMFVESLHSTSLFMVKPTSVTVMNDGSDGQPAVVRALGTLEPIPFLSETFGAAFPKDYGGVPALVDYVLAPGAEKVEIHYGVVNPNADYDLDSGQMVEGSLELFGFFQTTFNQRFVPGTGFGEPSGMADFVGFENGDIAFAYQGPDGKQLEAGGISQSGFELFAGEGIVTPRCTSSIHERAEIVVGEVGRGLDGLREAVRRANGLPAWSELSGQVLDDAGIAIEGAYVHVLGGAGYLVRTVTDAQGNYRVHVPTDEAVTVVPQKRGYPKSDGVVVSPGTASQDLTFDPHGTIRVTVVEEGTTTALPVRVQVIPTVLEAPTPDSYGAPDEAHDRLHVDFAMDGVSTLPVPPGEHRVIVSRGYEWEIYDQTVTFPANATLDLPVELAHTVDTTGSMSADFHIHSRYSADSADPVDFKVRGAIADGLDIPVSSEHEWVIDFQPMIESLGLTAWAFGISAEELTTFTYGHFGVVPLIPRPGELNNGARDWLDKPTKELFAEIDSLPEQPALIIHHPSGNGAFSSYFTAVDLDKTTGASSHPLWDENFDAIEVFNDSDFESNRDASVAHWFALLNAGKTFWAVGSSDSHYLRTSPIGYPRTFLALGYDAPTLASQEDVRDAVKQGRSTIGAGLFMIVEGPTASAPGDTRPRGTGTVDFVVTVRAPTWVTADSLEIIVNGETLGTEPLEPVGMGPGQEFVNQVSITLPDVPRAWVVFHAKGVGDLAPVHPGKEPFAVSNPIFFTQ